MKYIAITLIILFTVVFCKLEIKTQSNTESKAFDEQGSRFLVQFAKLINCASKPLERSCPKCLSNNYGYRMFFFYQTSRLQRYRFKFMIHYNDKVRKILISFSGPSVQEFPRYVQLIYTQGFGWVKSTRILVENEYKRVYYRQLRAILIKKINKIKKSGRAGYNFVFTGHSIGGSIATLASYDLTKSNIISKNVNHPKVYTFGALRIGDRRLVNLVNTLVTVYRVIRSDDYVVRIPNCYYSITALGWRCFTREIINRYIIVPSSPLFFYLQSYRYSLFYSIPVVNAVTSYFIAYRKSNSSARTRSLLNPRRLIPSRHRSKREHKGFKPIPMRTFNGRRTRTRTTYRKPGFRKMTFSSHNKKPLFTRPSRGSKQYQMKTNKFHLNDHSNLHNELRRKQKSNKFDDRTYQNQNTSEKELSNPRPKHNGGNFVSNNKKSVVNLPKLHITPTAAKTYYYNNIYYTQPYGLLVYYPPSFGTFTFCRYVNLVPQCETTISLPATFTISAHLSYFGEDFGTCDA